MDELRKNKLSINDELTEFQLFTSPDGQVKVEVFFHNESIWLPQKRMAELFGVQRPAITKHLKNVFESGELLEDRVCSILEHTTQHGAIEGKTQTQATKFYNLDAIISVGYRVNSSRATQFRIWATQLLKEYIIKGFAMDDDRLKNGRHFGKDYYRELLERVRSIRASERRIYQQVTDIFAECSIDYDPRSEVTQNFYAMIQNMFHFAITGMTAAEIVYDKVDKLQPCMGLKTWKSAPDGRIIKSDTAIAKNYLKEDEIKKLERLTTGYFDYIERLIENRTELTMQGLADSVSRFLEFNEYKVLDGKGQVSRQQANDKAAVEYDAFNCTQKITSDFDKFVKHVEGRKL